MSLLVTCKKMLTTDKTVERSSDNIQMNISTSMIAVSLVVSWINTFSKSTVSVSRPLILNKEASLRRNFKPRRKTFLKGRIGDKFFH